eukprot:s473_g1.t1
MAVESDPTANRMVAELLDHEQLLAQAFKLEDPKAPTPEVQAMVTKLLSRAEMLSNPKALEAIRAEAEGLVKAGTGDLGPVREKEEVRKEAKASGVSALRNQTTEDQQARQQLAKEIERLENELDTATSNARADSVILKALEKVNTKVTGLFEAQAEKTQEKARTYEDLQSEMVGLTTRVADLEENITRYRLREGTLLKEIQALQSERAAGDAFRTAMQQAKGELKQVRHDLRESMRDVMRLREEARGHSYVVERAQKRAANELKARMKIEEELLDQKQGRFEAQERLSQAALVEKELREELANLRSEFETLQQREAKAREIAKGMEAEIDELLKEAKTAQKTLQQSGLDKKKRGFWMADLNEVKPFPLSAGRDQGAGSLTLHE